LNSSIAEHAGCWFLTSGIHEANGGVARYFVADAGANKAVSTEITGYAASALCYLHSVTGRAEFLEAAVRAARFLTQDAWDQASHTFPFEPGSAHAYFFDVGIIARGLLAVSRATEDESFRSRAQDAALSLAFDFLGDGAFHPVIELPEKQPLAYEPKWSREPGCYQLKSAVAWLEAGDEHAGRMFEIMLASTLATHETFLDPARDTREKTMDRLHAYCYFLEALLFVDQDHRARAALDYGIKRVAALLREISPEFERSDVCAQLLRIRLIAQHLDIVRLDEAAAAEEADRAAIYQNNSTDPKLAGGFWFGRKGARMLPFMNPVSTAFCMQALELWREHRSGTWGFELHQLI
jgi:hypothetical protein